MQLRNGQVAADDRLGRLQQYDERSRAWRVRDLLEARKEYRRELRPRPARPGYDQSGPVCAGEGGDSGCVAFSQATALAASPHRSRPLTQDEVCRSYRRMQELDAWPGYGAGTSVLAGCQQALEAGRIRSYRWIGAGSQRADEDLLETLSFLGTVICGTRWLNSMFDPRPSGLLEVAPDSGEAGGHAFALISHRNAPLAGEGPAKIDCAVLQQTWGPGWGTTWYGVPGHAYIRLEDLFEHLLPREHGGEAVWLEEAA